MSDVDPDAYARLVAALPPRFEVQLMESDNVSTAFYECLRMGWSEDNVIGQVVQRVERGAHVGAIVMCLKGIARNRPLQRRTGPFTTAGSNLGIHPEQAVPQSRAERGEPDLSVEQIKERSALLARCWAEAIPADEAEQLMKELIEEQAPTAPVVYADF